MRTLSQKHHLGLSGHFSISKQLLETADRYGLVVEFVGNNNYHISSRNKVHDISKLCPSFIKHNDTVFKKAALKTFLEFLHQPVRVSLEQSSADILNSPEESRRTIHQLLRKLTTGSVHIPEYKDQELEKESAACHADTEREMREADSWCEDMEIGNINLTSASIPNSSFDPETGFAFCINYNKKSIKQTKLHQAFQECLPATKIASFKAGENLLSLNADELHSFCIRAAQNEALPSLIEEADFEEQVQKALTHVKKRAGRLTISSSFARVLQSSPSETDPKDKLRTLLQCTTALTPIVNSKTMRDAWSRYHFSERKDAPLDDIVQEFSVLHAVINKHLQQDTVTPAELEAISQEFYPLLAFAGKFSEALEQKEIFDVLQNASLAGVSLSDTVLDDHYLQTLKTLRKAAGQKQSILGHVTEATTESTLEFVGDIVNFIKESPKVAITFVTLASALYISSGGDSSAVAETTQNMILTFGEDGQLIDVPVADGAIPEEYLQKQSWHYDMGPLGLYKHYMYNNAVVGPAQTMLDWVRMAGHWSSEQLGYEPNANPAFSQMANAVVKPLADTLFDINVFQNASHAAFWMYMFSKGARHGLKGGSKIGQLFAPVIDLSYLAAIKPLEAVRLHKNPELHNRLMDLRSDIPPLIKGHNGHEADLLSGMAEAALLRADVEETFLKLKMAGTTQKITMDSHKVETTLNALAQFDFVLEHIASEIGVGETWHKIFLKEKLGAVITAFENFQEDQDEKAFKDALSGNLQELVQAQIRQTGNSTVYEAVFEQKAELKEHDILSRNANIRFGSLKRSDSLNTSFNQITDSSLFIIDRSKAASTASGVALWSGIVGTARTLQKIYDATPKKKMLFTSLTAIGTTAVALDMSGQSQALLGSTYGQIADMVSGASGVVASTGVTTGTFLIYNFWEDVLGVHILGGAALLGAGAAYHHANKRALSPLAATGHEYFERATNLDISDKWQNIKGALFHKEEVESVPAKQSALSAAISPCLNCSKNTTCPIENTLIISQNDNYFEEEHDL